MRFLAALILAISPLVWGAPASQALGDDKSVQHVNGQEFSKIEVTGVYQLAVRSGGEYDVRLVGREGSLERANIKVSNDTLYLGHKKSGNFRGTKTIVAKISLPNLRAIGISGVVDGEVVGIDAEDFRVDVSGVGDLQLHGKCGTMKADLSGVGDLDARDLKCRTVIISVSGVGDARVHADEVLDAHVSGIGDLTCYGSPNKVTKNKSFFSSISVH